MVLKPLCVHPEDDPMWLQEAGALLYTLTLQLYIVDALLFAHSRCVAAEKPQKKNKEGKHIKE